MASVQDTQGDWVKVEVETGAVSPATNSPTTLGHGRTDSNTCEGTYQKDCEAIISLIGLTAGDQTENLP
jgi:hypothetical protein